MRCAMADETLHLCDLEDDEELDEFEEDLSNEIDAQTAAEVLRLPCGNRLGR